MKPTRRQENIISVVPQITKTQIRVLATSDLHMQMTSFDYAKDRMGTGGSLAKLATMIKTARREAEQAGMSCVLFDNGDTLQGTPLGDFIAHESTKAPNPMVACMNYLRFDAGGLGNHDFDHGLQELANYLSQHNMPVVCSNLTANRLPTVQDNVIVRRPVSLDDPEGADLRVGILSSLPQKTALWSRHHVAGHAEFEPPLPVLQRKAAALKASGADLVIVLAHMGLALFDEGEEAQNQISEVAALSDVDVVVGGHTHLRFPGPDHAGLQDADCKNGTVHGTPVIQPGASAADLGVIDLQLKYNENEQCWSVQTSKVSLRPATSQVPQDREIIRLTTRAHEETRQFLSQPVANLKKPMNSFFALAHPSPIPSLLATAKRQAIESAIVGNTQASLPLLSVASALLTGGFDGPDNFLNLSSGQINRHHVAGMNPYANHVWAVKTTGKQIIDWLERSAMIFNTLNKNQPDQLLVDPRVPGFRFDTIYGLTYEFDPRMPSKFDASGRPISGQNGRVSNICWQGNPLREDEEFLVATTDHRASGGGLYRTFTNADIVVNGHAPLQQAVLDYFKTPNCEEIRSARPWRFVTGMDRTAILLTAPQAIDHLDDITHLNPEPCGETSEGFLKLRLHF